MQSQNQEGCRIAGHVKVNKVSSRILDSPGIMPKADVQVIGNLQFSPGRSFQNNMMQMMELVGRHVLSTGGQPG